MTHRVLVLDDSLTVRMDLAEAFAAAGFDVVPCGSLREARDALRKHPVDVAVLDVRLPDGDGFELLADIRAKGSETPTSVLMLSTAAEVEDRIRGLEIGADDYVGKPYDRGYVTSRAHELLRARNRKDPEDRPTVLLIDDSPTYRHAVGAALGRAGYNVLATGSGEEGLRLAADTRPVAIVVDGVMPGIDGATVIRRVRLDAALRHTPCVLLTGSEDIDSELRGLDAGADAFVRKEENLDVIMARLAAVLRHARSAPAEGESLLGAKRLLVCDDSSTYRAALADALRSDGYDVVQVASGQEALDMVLAQPVDCVLMDLVMPGISGNEVVRRMKASAPRRDVPIIAVSATDDPRAVVDVLAAGADDFIRKSSDFEPVRARVLAQLRRRQFEDEQRRAREALLRQELEAASARAAREVAEARATLVAELERKNKELEAFSYSVSHDLRAPLRSILGFTSAAIDECGSAMPDAARDYLGRVRASANRMSELIDDMLELSRVGRAELRREPIDLATVARSVATDLQNKTPERQVTVVVGEVPPAEGDERLFRILLENLLGNAFKFTARCEEPRVEFGARTEESGVVYYVKDNGAGFDMKYAGRLFNPFQRLHNERDFPGTGIGLATVLRIVDRHGGRVWAKGELGAGATVEFTVPPARAAAGELARGGS